MDVDLVVKGKVETCLVVPSWESEKGNEYVVFSEGNYDAPYLRLRLSDDKLTIVEQSKDLSDDELSTKLEELSLGIVEANLSGDDLTASTFTKKSELSRPYDPEKIRVEQKYFSLRQIHDMIKDGDLNLSPDFQRKLVWNRIGRSRLIESILLRIPLPMFYFSQDEEGVFYVVDGLQRLSAINSFMENEYSLRGLEYLDSCEGKFYSKEGQRLDDKYIRRVNSTQISVSIIDPQSPTKVKYDIFRRLNTGGKPLNAQELRNCIASKETRELLKLMVALPSFKEAVGEMSDSRMGAQELALRFILFKNYYDTTRSIEGVEEYSDHMDEDLDACIERLRICSEDKRKEFVSSFDLAMRNAFYLFGKQAFRKVDEKTTEESKRAPFNKALFTSFAVLLSTYNYEDVSKVPSASLLPLLASEIKRDSEYLRYLSYGTNGWKNIVQSFIKANSILQYALVNNGKSEIAQL